MSGRAYAGPVVFTKPAPEAVGRLFGVGPSAVGLLLNRAIYPSSGPSSVRLRFRPGLGAAGCVVVDRVPPAVYRDFGPVLQPPDERHSKLVVMCPQWCAKVASVCNSCKTPMVSQTSQTGADMAKAAARSKTAPARRPWSKDDVRLLKRMARKEPAAKIAKALKRTESATRQKATGVGISLSMTRKKRAPAKGR